MLHNKPFVAFFLVAVSIFVMLGLQKALALHMNTYFWALETQEIVYLLYAFFGATIITVPFVKYIIDRLDKKATMNLGTLDAASIVNCANDLAPRRLVPRK